MALPKSYRPEVVETNLERERKPSKRSKRISKKNIKRNETNELRSCDWDPRQPRGVGSA